MHRLQKATKVPNAQHAGMVDGVQLDQHFSVAARQYIWQEKEGKPTFLPDWNVE